MHHRGTDRTRVPAQSEEAPLAGGAVRRRRPPQPVSGRRRLFARAAALPLLFGVAAGMAGCDGSTPGGTLMTPATAQLSAASAGTLSNGRGRPAFLRCDELQYEAVTLVIGPEGGVLDIGPHRLSIPAGALAEPTEITGEMPTSTIASVRLSPHGLNFAVPATLTLDYKHCQRNAARGETVVYFDENGDALEWPVTVTRGFRATSEITHFSRYGMSSGRTETL
jgi:hypothetical protein